MGMELVQILVYPGFIFLFIYALALQYVDRKAYALMQNRVGPPWFQPFADFVKLMAKEYIIPKRGNAFFFFALPTGMLAVVLTAMVAIPIGSASALFPFTGDILVVVFLLTTLGILLFLMGLFSNNPYTLVGGARVISQMVSYEVPLLLAILTPAIIAGSWSITEIAAFFRANPVFLIFQIPALGIALIALQAKLERIPFDIPEAETEIADGPLAELSGRGLGLAKLAADIAMVVGVALLANLFLGGFAANPIIGFVEFIIKTLALVFILVVMRTVMARLRVEQMMLFCWHRLVPVALAQVLIAVIIKGWWLA